MFEKIMATCPKKKVMSLCKKLNKKCSFKSGADTENLCHLSYWLYVYGKAEDSLRCIALTHDVPFEQNYNVWTFIHAMWGLEIRILRESGQNEKADVIAKTIDQQYLLPTKLMETPEEIAACERKRRSRFAYPDILRPDNIDSCLQNNDHKGANVWRFIALLGMIGTTETGLYPELNAYRAEINSGILAYIHELAKEK